MASSGSDTEMDSGPSSGYSSSWDGSPAASPREAAAPAGPPAAARPALRVPPLSLRANLADLPRDVRPGCDSAPSTARRMNAGTSSVPSLALPSRPAAGVTGAAAASPPHTSRGMPSLRGPAPAPNQPQQQLQDRHQQAAAPPPPQLQQQPASVAVPLSLDVLSPALTLQSSQLQGSGSCTSRAHLAQHCASQLGVPAERLRFFALSEVAGPQQLPVGCSRAAVEVTDSRFSLAALEELVAENQQLKEAAAQATQRQQEQQEQQPVAGSGEEVVQLQAQLRQLQLENDTMRQQLRLSESLRRKGRKALTDLKQEFEAVIRMVMLDQAKRVPPLRCKPRPGGGTPAALDDASLPL